MKNHAVVSRMHRGQNPIQYIKNWIWWTFVRRMRGAPEKFFYFPSKAKTDYRIEGVHWSGNIRIFRRNNESHKEWNQFCFKMVYNSRHNKDKAARC